ncbi:DNA replication protein DnaC [Ruminococcaceae bacterium YRB3002]|nr:DNA replication protein DnaC [Ruminococcaceae bacterium YRB3002]
MTSIREIIKSSNFSVESAREIDRENRIRQVYSEYPDLEKLDNDIVATRATMMIATLEDNKVEIAHCESLEKKLLDKRERFMARNGIDPAFDEERPVCSRCGDTGFYKNSSGVEQVCPCRKKELEECYDLSGLKNHSHVKLDNYKDDHFGKKNHRAKLRRRLIEILMGKDKPDTRSLWILSDGIQTGKTFLAVYYIKFAVNLGYSARYMRLDELINIYDEDITELAEDDILVIDDYIANMTMTGMVGTRLNALLESRRSPGKITLIVTSFPVNSIIADSDVRVTGKLKSAGLINEE